MRNRHISDNNNPTLGKKIVSQHELIRLKSSKDRSHPEISVTTPTHALSLAVRDNDLLKSQVRRGHKRQVKPDRVPVFQHSHVLEAAEPWRWDSDWTS